MRGQQQLNDYPQNRARWPSSSPETSSILVVDPVRFFQSKGFNSQANKLANPCTDFNAHDSLFGVVLRESDGESAKSHAQVKNGNLSSFLWQIRIELFPF